MSIFYRFGVESADPAAIICDRMDMSVRDLKLAIVDQRKINNITEFDLSVRNQQTHQEYTSEEELVPRGTTVIVARKPMDRGEKKIWRADRVGMGGKEALADSAVVSSSTEEDRLEQVVAQSGTEYGSSFWEKTMRSRGARPLAGEPPRLERRFAAGIPAAMLLPADGDTQTVKVDLNGAPRMTAVEKEGYSRAKVEKTAWLEDREEVKAAAVEKRAPSELYCIICHEILNSAVIFPCCVAAACDECARDKLVDTDHHCPRCHEGAISPDVLIPNPHLRKKVAEFLGKSTPKPSATLTTVAAPQAVTREDRRRLEEAVLCSLTDNLPSPDNQPVADTPPAEASSGLSPALDAFEVASGTSSRPVSRLSEGPRPLSPPVAASETSHDGDFSVPGDGSSRPPSSAAAAEVDPSVVVIDLSNTSLTDPPTPLNDEKPSPGIEPQGTSRASPDTTEVGVEGGMPIATTYSQTSMGVYQTHGGYAYASYSHSGYDYYAQHHPGYLYPSVAPPPYYAHPTSAGLTHKYDPRAEDDRIFHNKDRYEDEKEWERRRRYQEGRRPPSREEYSRRRDGHRRDHHHHADHYRGGRDGDRRSGLRRYDNSSSPSRRPTDESGGVRHNLAELMEAEEEEARRRASQHEEEIMRRDLRESSTVSRHSQERGWSQDKEEEEEPQRGGTERGIRRGDKKEERRRRKEEGRERSRDGRSWDRSSRDRSSRDRSSRERSSRERSSRERSSRERSSRDRSQEGVESGERERKKQRDKQLQEARPDTGGNRRSSSKSRSISPGGGSQQQLGPSSSQSPQRLGWQELAKKQDPASKLKCVLNTLDRSMKMDGKKKDHGMKKEPALAKDLDGVSDLRDLLNKRKGWECMDDSCSFLNPTAVAKCKKCGLSRFPSRTPPTPQKNDGEDIERALEERQRSLSRKRSTSDRFSPSRRLSRPETRQRSSDSEEDRRSRSEEAKARRRSVSTSPFSDGDQRLDLRRGGSPEKKRPSRRRRKDISVSPRVAVEPATTVPCYEEFQDTLRQHISESSRLIRSNSSRTDKESGSTSPLRHLEEGWVSESDSCSGDDVRMSSGGRREKSSRNRSGRSSSLRREEGEASNDSYEKRQQQSVTPLSRSLSRSSRPSSVGGQQHVTSFLSDMMEEEEEEEKARASMFVAHTEISSFAPVSATPIPLLSVIDQPVALAANCGNGGGEPCRKDDDESDTDLSDPGHKSSPVREPTGRGGKGSRRPAREERSSSDDEKEEGRDRRLANLAKERLAWLNSEEEEEEEVGSKKNENEIFKQPPSCEEERGHLSDSKSSAAEDFELSLEINEAEFREFKEVQSATPSGESAPFFKTGPEPPPTLNKNVLQIQAAAAASGDKKKIAGISRSEGIKDKISDKEIILGHKMDELEDGVIVDKDCMARPHKEPVSLARQKSRSRERDTGTVMRPGKPSAERESVPRSRSRDRRPSKDGHERVESEGQERGREVDQAAGQGDDSNSAVVAAAATTPSRERRASDVFATSADRSRPEQRKESDRRAKANDAKKDEEEKVGGKHDECQATSSGSPTRRKSERTEQLTSSRKKSHQRKGDNEGGAEGTSKGSAGERTVSVRKRMLEAELRVETVSEEESSGAKVRSRLEKLKEQEMPAEGQQLVDGGSSTHIKGSQKIKQRVYRRGSRETSGEARERQGERSRASRHSSDSRRSEEDKKPNPGRRLDDSRKSEEGRRTEERRQSQDSRGRAEDSRRREEGHKTEDSRRAGESKKSNDSRGQDVSRRREELGRSDDIRKLEENRRGEDSRRSDDSRRSEERRRLEESRRIEEIRRAEDRRKEDKRKREREIQEALERKRREEKELERREEQRKREQELLDRKRREDEHRRRRIEEEEKRAREQKKRELKEKEEERERQRKETERKESRRREAEILKEKEHQEQERKEKEERELKRRKEKQRESEEVEREKRLERAAAARIQEELAEEQKRRATDRDDRREEGKGMKEGLGSKSGSEKSVRRVIEVDPVPLKEKETKKDKKTSKKRKKKRESSTEEEESTSSTQSEEDDSEESESEDDMSWQVISSLLMALKKGKKKSKHKKAKKAKRGEETKSKVESKKRKGGQEEEKSKKKMRRESDEDEEEEVDKPKPKAKATKTEAKTKKTERLSENLSKDVKKSGRSRSASAKKSGGRSRPDTESEKEEGECCSEDDD